MKTPRQLPSQHETERVAREREQDSQDQARKRKEGQLRQAVDAALKSEWGLTLWSYLFNVCGYNKPSLTRVAGGDIASLSTECKDAQRLIYLELRKLATPELLAKAEFQAEFGGEDDLKSKKGDTKNAAS